MIPPFHVALTAFITAGAIAAFIPTARADTQHLTIGNGVEVATLDPHKALGVAESNVLRDLFEGLVITNPQGQVVPGIASHWQTTDYQRYQFTLRDDVTWSNGDPITAEDFVYSFRRVLAADTASPYAWYLAAAHIRNAEAILAGKKPVTELGVQALQPNTLVIQLDRPVPYFIDMLSHTTFLPVHQASVTQHQDRWTQPEHLVSNGAYQLKQWVINEHITLKRNPRYWNNDDTAIDEVTFLALENPTSEMHRFLRGEIDMTSGVPLAQYDRLAREYPKHIFRKPRLCTEFYQFNTQHPPFNDPRVRQALAYAIDRDILTERLLAQGQRSAYTLVPPTTQDYLDWTPPYGQLSQKERDQHAKELLNQAGFNEQQPLTFSLLYNTSDQIKKIAVAISAMWQSVLPVSVELVNQEWKTYLSSTEAGDYQVARLGWCADYNEASSFLNYLHSDSSGGQHYQDPQFDKLLNNASNAETLANRVTMYQRSEALLVDTMPIIPLYFGIEVRLVNPDLHGYDLTTPTRIYSKDLSFRSPPEALPPDVR